MPKGKPELIRIDEGKIRKRLDQIVRGTVEETLNALLEAEADAPAGQADTKDLGKGHILGSATMT